ncbi:MAG: hypothetical protein GF408_00265 [Candidatus Omnitrophica bacterium]|nr:hypothetical protein [Candidatus Omnitrophota bacterium]
MKELVYRNILGSNPRKKEVSIEEVSRKSMNNVSRKWTSKYFVKEKFTAENPTKLRAWIRFMKRNGVKKNCHLLRQLDERTGENKIICKVLGEFYVAKDLTAYKIVYMNEIKIDIKTD